MTSQRVLKADFGLADLATGGLLNPEQTDRFIRTLIDTPTLLNEVRPVPMNSPKMEVNKILFGSRRVRPMSRAASRSCSPALSH